METHYYDVDYRYNGITGEVKDNPKEITRDEFRRLIDRDGPSVL